MIFALLVSLCGQVSSVSAVTSSQEKAVGEHCASIREVLKNVQKDDSRARVYLGAYYEAVLVDFVTPLNVRLVENNLSSANLVENQNKLADAKALFADDFVSYQQGLEELVATNCEREPKGFYEKLEKVREKRKTVEQDAARMRNLVGEHVKLVKQLKEEME